MLFRVGRWYCLACMHVYLHVLAAFVVETNEFQRLVLRKNVMISMRVRNQYGCILAHCELQMKIKILTPMNVG